MYNRQSTKLITTFPCAEYKIERTEHLIYITIYSAIDSLKDTRNETARRVTLYVPFTPVDPIKVPIIISDVFRCNMFDLVSDIL